MSDRAKGALPISVTVQQAAARRVRLDRDRRVAIRGEHEHALLADRDTAVVLEPHAARVPEERFTLSAAGAARHALRALQADARAVAAADAAFENEILNCAANAPITVGARREPDDSLVTWVANEKGGLAQQGKVSFG